MRTTLAVAMTVVFAAASTGADDPKVIIEKAIQAHGGKDVLSKDVAFTADMTGEIQLPFGQTKFEGKLATELPDKYRMAMSMNIGGSDVTIVQLVNGETVRMTVNGMAQPLPKSVETELRTAIALQEIGQIVTLLNSDKYKLKTGDPTKVGGKPAATVIVTPKDGEPVELAFDEKSGYLVQTVREALSPEEKTVKETTVLSDFKKVADAVIGSKIAVTHDGKPFMTATMSDMKLAEKLPPATFAVDD